MSVWYTQGMDFYKWTLQFADPRVADWPLISTPIPTILLVAFYLLFILYVGPKIMKNRAPIDFGLFLPAYNFMLVALNYYIVHQALTGSYNANYSYVCTPLRSDSYDPNEMKVATAVWWYYFSKNVELFDTVLFVLRKNTRQLTFLHVYHHSTMPLLWWIGAKWIPGGQSFVGVMLNSGVHVVMYAYYGLAALGPKVQKYLWWKKYITMLQLSQFFVAIYHTGMSLYVDCPSPKWMHWSLIAYASSLIILFGNFYLKAYSKTPKRSKATESSKANNNGSGDSRKTSWSNVVEQEMADDELSLRRRTKNGNVVSNGNTP